MNGWMNEWIRFIQLSYDMEINKMRLSKIKIIRKRSQLN